MVDECLEGIFKESQLEIKGQKRRKEAERASEDRPKEERRCGEQKVADRLAAAKPLWSSTPQHRLSPLRLTIVALDFLHRIPPTLSSSILLTPIYSPFVWFCAC